MNQRPNILFIISDQMTAALTGVYGHPVVQTPHLNRLVGKGVRYDAAYTLFPSYQSTSDALCTQILADFDPDKMAAEDLASLYRRRLIGDTMKWQGSTWSHYPHVNARRGAMDQYMPPELS